MATQPEKESLEKSRRLYGRLAISSLFALALLHGLHPFFFTLFFWISLGFGLVTAYYHILIKRLENPNVFRASGSRPFSSKFQQPNFQSSSTTSPATEKNKKVAIAIVIIFGLIVFFSIIGVFFADEEIEDFTQNYVESEVYNLAWDEYNAKNYQNTINILRPIMLSGNQDSQAMLLLGDGYYEIKNLDSAYVWYDKAYGLGQRSANLSHLLGYILDEKGSTQNAIPFYKEALSMDSAKTEIYERLAELEPNNSNWYLQKAKQYKEQ